MSFLTEYTRLNSTQKKAVDTLDGPVLVIAGPGTGKTQLLSMRVANILKDTDADASNILCLTFTNKAATNMRDRLIRLAGTEAQGVMTKTFHGFAAEVINRNPDYFWNGARMTLAPDAVQLEIIQAILSRLPLDNPLALTFAGTYTVTGDVQNALRLTKEAGLTPDKLRAILTVNLAYMDVIEPVLVDILSAPLSAKKLPQLQASINELPEQAIDDLVAPLLSLSTVIKESLSFAIAQDEGSGKTKHVGNWKRRWIQTIDGQKGSFTERKRNEWWLALADVYQDYRAALHTRGYYDYSDMLVEVITQLEKNPDMLASVQEQYQYVLIDEFQDTNAAQLRLAHLVADHYSANGKPNLMVVGDDDQSIYKFNGAELNNMLSFRRSYPSTKLIVLVDNYRSTSQILATASRVIEQAEDRLVNREADVKKELKAVNAPKEGIIEHRSYPTRDYQLSQVADRIQQDMSGESTIAVLARGHDSLRQLAALLLARGVPVRYEQQSNILDHPAVQQVMLLAQTTSAIQEGDETAVNHHLSQVLRHPLWGLPPTVLWKLAVDNRKRPHWLDSLATSDDEYLRSIASWLSWLAQQASVEPLSVMIEYFLGLRSSETFTSPVRRYFIDRQTLSNNYLHALSAIHLLRSLVQDFSLNSAPSLTDFVDLLTLYQENQKVVTDQSPFVSVSPAVELLTVHKAKGLEFDQVYVIDAIEANWQPSSHGRKPPANLPLRPNLDDHDDYARLMYVAVTRAKQSLIATSFRDDGKGNELLATPLIDAAVSKRVDLQVGSQKEVTAMLEEHLVWPRLEQTDERALLSGQLENYSLSATSLLNFLDVSMGGPDYFLERNLLRLPQVNTTSLAHGTAIHHALETAQKLVNLGSFDLKKVQKDYVASLKQEHLPIESEERYTNHGVQVLEQLFTTLNYHLPKGSLPEQDFYDVQVGAARIGGSIDRLDTNNDTAVIVDYKTGAPLQSLTTKDQSKAIKAWRHRTQLLFYTLLLQASGRYKHIKTIETQMVYVQAATSKELVRSYIPNEEELDRLRRLISVIWPRIKTLDLPDTSRYSANYQGIQTFEQDLLDAK